MNATAPARPDAPPAAAALPRGGPAASIGVSPAPAVQYLLRIADTALIHAQRLAEWCGHGPVIEEDLALTNMALDLIGQARALYTHVGRLDGQACDEDQLAFLRDERDYRNLTLAELPRGDFAFTMVRALMLAGWFRLLWQRLAASSDAEVAAIACKAVKEARYHQQHAADWVVRLGDGTAESARRTQQALQAAWPYAAELFEDDAVDAAAEVTGLGPLPGSLREPWLAEWRAVLQAAGLAEPPTGAFRSTGRHGVHTEHLGFLLATMQHLQRSFPGGAW
jgi:ring-1,2-phenylacetyl-CoA epoxidase subunit PaaC